MAHKRTNPSSVSFPQNYHHSVEVEEGCRFLFVAGQTGVALDGSVPEGIEGQAKQAFKNLENVLAESDYGLGDVVFMKTFLTRREDRSGYQKVRAKIYFFCQKDGLKLLPYRVPTWKESHVMLFLKSQNI